MSKHVIVECDDCSTARRGDSYPELWRKLKAEGWKADNARGVHFCPVCIAIRQKERAGWGKAMIMGIELKPCPACGDYPEIAGNVDGTEVWIACGNLRKCRMGGPTRSTVKEAAQAWNDLPRAKKEVKR